MKSSLLLHLATVSSALVLPDQNVLAEVQVQRPDRADSVLSSVPSAADIADVAESNLDRVAGQVRDAIQKYRCKAHHSIDQAISLASDEASFAADKLSDSYFNAKAWVNTEADDILTSDPLDLFERDGDTLEAEKSQEHEKDKGHHGHKKGNATVYELITKSKYTTKLAKLINDYPDLVEALNSTEGHYTVFAPTDKAFEKIPEHAPKPPKEFIEKILMYHVSPQFYPAGRVLVTRTIPTLLKSENLAQDPQPQRLGTQISFRGLTVNYYSRIVAVNIFGSNGVIHGVDSLILPPPPSLKIIDLLPEEFSTLELGLFKTGLYTNESATRTGGTLFAPSNFAFTKLGARVNAFLFSPPGVKYLKALLLYHYVPSQTLYSDYYVDGRSSEGEAFMHPRKGRRGPPRGYKHFDLETAFEDKSLAIDVSRYGRLIDIRINGFSHVIRSDGVAKDGVIQEVNSVLIPPHRHGHGDAESKFWDGESEMSVEELVQRLEPYVKGAVPNEL